MKTTITLLLLSLAFCLGGCSNHEHSGQSETGEAPQEHSHGGFTHTHEAAPEEEGNRPAGKSFDLAVDLNDGVKWKTSRSTHEEVNRMKELMEGLPMGATVEDYRALSKKMDQRFLKLFATNTLSGEAGTQLQNYLIPMSLMLKNMRDCTAARCIKHLEELKTHLDKFGEYFE